MKPIKTKAQLRNELSHEVEQYLSRGGAVENIPSGVSGNTDNANLFTSSAHFGPKQERTPVTDVIRELDSRKKIKPRSFKPVSGPRKKLITDDFGEPVRWVWSDQ